MSPNASDLTAGEANCRWFWTKPEIVGERQAIEKLATIEPTVEGDRAKVQNKCLSVVSGQLSVVSCPLSIRPAERSRTCDRRRGANLRAAGRRGPFGVARENDAESDRPSP
jgi:hypothetical protein